MGMKKDILLIGDPHHGHTAHILSLMHAHGLSGATMLPVGDVSFSQSDSYTVIEPLPRPDTIYVNEHEKGLPTPPTESKRRELRKKRKKRPKKKRRK